jgi:hypothetical protein
MQMPSWIGVCGAVDTAAVDTAAVDTAAAVEAVASVLALAGRVPARGVVPCGAGDAALAAAAGVAPAPTPAKTMLAVNAAEPAKSGLIPIATSAPFRVFSMALAQEQQRFSKLISTRAGR